MTVREDTIERPDGSAGIYGVVDRPDYAVVIAVDGDRLALVEQYRYPMGARRWEFPMGTTPDQPDIDPRELAARELREETGLTAGSLRVLGRLDVAPGIMSQRGWVFLATDITEGEPEREHEEQDMHFAWFPRARFEEMILVGEITDAQSIAAYAQLLLVERLRR
ncbi:NUDIX domain-containing protein [Mycolicibacterium sp. CBM1]